ncbi:MAG: hypothetical protein IJV07_02250 [Alphaproteobacteria bacterium]|nr:hypothetical protein [Alphaproteobacteria bacterium]
MKKILFCLWILFAGYAWAEDRTTEGLTEAQQLGITAGTALACNAGGKLDDFELIASRIIANKALTAEAEQQGYREYAESKFRAYSEQRSNPQESCGAVLDSFTHLPIFRSVVFADGGLKMYDGTYLKPLRPVQQKPNKPAQKSAKKSAGKKR